LSLSPNVPQAVKNHRTAGRGSLVEREDVRHGGNRTYVNP
jgi:hypothetical protein